MESHPRQSHLEVSDLFFPPSYKDPRKTKDNMLFGSEAQVYEKCPTTTTTTSTSGSEHSSHSSHSSDDDHVEPAIYAAKKRKYDEVKTVELKGEPFGITLKVVDQDKLAVICETPDIDVDTLKLSIVPDTSKLTIIANKLNVPNKRVRNEQGELIVDEVDSSRYEREVGIPPDVDLTHLSTTYEDGLLTLTFTEAGSKRPIRPVVVVPKKKKRTCIVM